MDDAQEEWRPVLGWEGVYDVSNWGRVRRVKAAQGTTPGTILKCQVGTHGYLTVGLFDRKRQSPSRTVHSLVAQAFLGPCPPGHCINHKDSDRTNPRASNLEFVTPKGNIEHARRAGRLRGGGTRGERSHLAKLSEEQVLEIRKREKHGDSLSELAKQYGVTKQAIWLICKRRNWAHI